MGDCPLQKEAQEGSRGGCCQEKEQEDPEVPESRSWRHPPGHHGQEEPEARGEEGPERAGRQSRQGAEEADCFQRLLPLLTRKQRKPKTRRSRMYRNLLQELQERDKH